MNEISFTLEKGKLYDTPEEAELAQQKIEKGDKIKNLVLPLEDTGGKIKVISGLIRECDYLKDKILLMIEVDKTCGGGFHVLTLEN